MNATPTRRLRALALVAAVLTAWGVDGRAVSAQTPTGRELVESLEVGPLEFEPPTPERHEIGGVRVLLLEDHTLPLVDVLARFRGGYGLYPREWYASAMGLPALLRSGGTVDLPPDSVDELLEYYAVQSSFGTGGGSISIALNTLTEHLDTAFGIWSDLIAKPRFEPRAIELWRGRELESARRLQDDPGNLAYARFNRLMYGDHPVGWSIEPSDLDPRLVAPDRFREMHRRIVCRDNLILGVTGDVSWEGIRPLLKRLVDDLAPCPERIPPAPAPDIRRGGGVFLLERDLEQAFIVMAHPTSVHLADERRYYAATIGNSILGGGGFNSRLLSSLRTRQGLTYAASSIWTMPRRYDGVVGATTSTRPEMVVPAIRDILDVMREMTQSPPTSEELRTAVDVVVNGFAFNFETPAQIVSRMMFYVAEDWPEDWLERYADGIQEVEPSDIREVFAEQVRPDEMTILVVGDPGRIGREALAALGPVTVLAIDEPQSGR
ncbi:MAG: M16 family metallopeptidase [Gemmatimonadales bacterium]